MKQSKAMETLKAAFPGRTVCLQRAEWHNEYPGLSVAAEGRTDWRAVVFGAGDETCASYTGATAAAVVQAAIDGEADRVANEEVAR